MLLYNFYLSFISFSTQLAILVVNILHFFIVTIANVSPNVALLLIIAVVILMVQIPYIGSIAVFPYIIITALGITAKDTTWSVVYDAKTKLPIDPAYITVRNMQGLEITTIITDLNGRFSLLLPQGLYSIEANKTNYTFPSTLMHGEASDGKYSNLYFGSLIEIKDKERAVAISIPMDPISEDWNQVEKKRRKLFYQFDDKTTYLHAARLYGVVAIVLTFFHFTLYPDGQAIDYLIAAIVVAMAAILHTRRTRQYSHSFVIDKHTNAPLAFAKVCIFSAATHSKTAQKITSFEGQFTCLLPKGNYYLTIDRRDEKGQYSLVFTSEVFSVNDGYIGKRFTV